MINLTNSSSTRRGRRCVKKDRSKPNGGVDNVVANNHTSHEIVENRRDRESGCRGVDEEESHKNIPIVVLSLPSPFKHMFLKFYIFFSLYYF